MDRRSKAVLSLSVFMVLVLIVPGIAMAKKGPPVSEVSNNLSVPVIMVGGGALAGVTPGTEAPSALIAPTGTPLNLYPIDPTAFYYVQRVHKWQAQAYTTTAAVSATAGWGDNLTGDAKLKTGSPIRVELGLFESTTIEMLGYIVDKLEPDKLDRESAYGTLAASGEPNAAAYPILFPNATKGGVRVYDSLATFSIQKVGGAYVVPPGTTAKAEINAGGAVIYGYSLRVMTAGEYLITYVTPTVTLTGTDGGTIGSDYKSVSLVITVVAGGGGGGRP